MNIQKMTLVIFVLISTNLIAQNHIRFGAKIGGNLTGFHTGKSADTDNVLFNIGGLAELDLTNSFSLQVELLYNKKGGLFLVRDVPVSQFFSVDTRLEYIDIPIQGKWEFIKNLSFDFGPQIGFLIDSEGEIVNSQNDNGKKIELSTITNTIDFALNGGFSYKFYENFFLQARYSYGLTEIFDNKKYKNSVISLSLGYLFD